ncbi:hypothetical protein UPYG_G00330650 [Umbra pygmaea]|uniref:BAALC binder of MAP3K1 and KLF4 n=1 Tax=Umbra pygmaea TaxID=75934 RepID=A0ABD0WC40_UMBPY
MGCGGSRSDTIIEPRYHESWTGETESTWLTNTDTEAALSNINSKGLEAFQKEKRVMVTTGTQCGKQVVQSLTSSGSNQQRRTRRPCQDMAPLQTNKESRRRSSKEASAPCKDLHPVSVSRDNPPVNSAPNER